MITANTTTPVTHVTVQAPTCWASFTNAASSAMISVANGISKIWAGIRSCFNSVYAALTPSVARATVWMRANPQTAAIGALITGIATIATCYFYCRKPAVPVPAVPVQSVPVKPAQPVPVQPTGYVPPTGYFQPTGYPFTTSGTV